MAQQDPPNPPHLDLRNSQAFRDVIGVQHHHHRPGEGQVGAVMGLPAVDEGFIGREADLRASLTLLEADTGGPRTIVFEGAAGAGKTELALALGHQALENGLYSGALFVDLRGYSDPVDSDLAVRLLLHALEVPQERWSTDPGARSSLYRSALESWAKKLGGPFLVFADNVSDAEQIKELTPGGRDHRLLITSRNRLVGLGRHVPVRPLDDASARALITRALEVSDPDDARAEQQEELTRLVRACDGLPLALRTSAQILESRQEMSVAELADRVERSEYGLFRFWAETRALREVFDQTRAGLPSDAADLLILLGLAPGPDISTALVAAMVGITEDEAYALLGSLERARLVERGKNRWHMRNLAVGYAMSLTQGRVMSGLYAHARSALLDHYAKNAGEAAQWLANPAGMGPNSVFADQNQALDWFAGERLALLNAVTLAARVGHRASVTLPFALVDFHLRNDHFEDMVVVNRVAVQNAHRSENQDKKDEQKAYARNNLGIGLRLLGRPAEALEEFDRARTIFEELDDDSGQGAVWNNMGAAFEQLEDPVRELEAYQKSREHHSMAGDPSGAGGALISEGSALRRLKRYKESLSCYKQAQRAFETSGDLAGQAWAQRQLGLLISDMGGGSDAITLLTRSRDLYREIGQETLAQQIVEHLDARTQIHSAVSEMKDLLEGVASPDTSNGDASTRPAHPS